MSRSPRRRVLVAAGAALVAARAGAAFAQARPEVVLCAPGPGSAVSAIPELAAKIGADALEGLALRLKFVGGGGVAIREINNGNAQFGVFGITAAMNENALDSNARKSRLVALAAVENRAPLTLMVRTDLAEQVRRIDDLRDRVLGVHSNSLQTKTNGQQLLELLLRQHRLPVESARFVAVGQSWETQSSALRSRIVDVIISEEPFGARIEQAGLARPLLRFGSLDRPVGIPGEGFLRGSLIASSAWVADHPQLARAMVRVVQRTLAWRRSHSNDEVVAMLGQGGDEAAAFKAMLRAYPQQFSEDGRFSDAQLRDTQTFFEASIGDHAAARKYEIEGMIVDQWAGRRS